MVLWEKKRNNQEIQNEKYQKECIEKFLKEEGVIKIKILTIDTCFTLQLKDPQINLSFSISKTKIEEKPDLQPEP